MKLLIIGKQGFIGKSLFEYFCKKTNYEVDGTTSEELNLLDEDNIYTYLKEKTYDVIINTATFSKSDAIKYNYPDELNYDLRMFFNLAKYNHLYKKMIYFGSGAEYDKRQKICAVNEAEIRNKIPVTNYGFSKYIMNLYAEKSRNIYNLRIFGLYGKYEDYRKKFITGACAKAVCNLPITIRQNVFFDFLYINDFCIMVHRFLNLESPQYHNYNISSGEKIDLFTLAKLVTKVSKKQLPIIICKKGLANEYTADNSRLIHEIGKIELTRHETAIQDIYTYYLQKRDEIDIMSLVYQG